MCVCACTHACARCVCMQLTYTRVSHAHAARMACHANTRACSWMTCQFVDRAGACMQDNSPGLWPKGVWDPGLEVFVF